MRKQDNSKLIYLLIGVVAVFILVFQYKSWCSAAEIEIVEKYSEEVDEAISSIPLEEVVVDDTGVSEFISEAPILEASSETVVQNFDDSSIVEELKKSNEYWELFLDSYSLDIPVPSQTYSFYLSSTGIVSQNTTWRSIVFDFSDLDSFTFFASSSFLGGLRYSFVDFIPSVGDSVDVSSSPSIVFSSSPTRYLVVSYYFSEPFDYSAFSTIRESFTLSELGAAVIQNGNNVSDILIYVLITCCFVCCFISLQIAWHTRSQIRKWSCKDSH